MGESAPGPLRPLQRECASGRSPGMSVRPAQSYGVPDCECARARRASAPAGPSGAARGGGRGDRGAPVTERGRQPRPLGDRTGAATGAARLRNLVQNRQAPPAGRAPRSRTRSNASSHHHHPPHAAKIPTEPSDPRRLITSVGGGMRGGQRQTLLA